MRQKRWDKRKTKQSAKGSLTFGAVRRHRLDFAHVGAGQADAGDEHGGLLHAAARPEGIFVGQIADGKSERFLLVPLKNDTWDARQTDDGGTRGRDLHESSLNSSRGDAMI